MSVLAAAAICWIAYGSPAGAQENPESLISRLIDPAGPDAPALRSGPEVRAFYTYRQFAPAWADEKNISEAIGILRDAGSDGLDPAAFRLGLILADRDAGNALKSAEFDVLLTDAMLSYIREMSGSRTDPTRISRFIAIASPAAPAPEILEGSLTAGTLESLPDKLAPPHPEYALLKKALAHYRQDKAHPERVMQIIANMERWRWLPTPFADYRVEVNSADSTLKLVKGDDVLFSTRLVTGRPSTPTPLFEATISAVTVNPYWDIPGDIALHEILPRAERRPEYFELHHIVGDRPGGGLRQLPGPGNVLGRYLLEMPNGFDAYLHDTPAKGLFEKSERHLSHGCMRVENMDALASLLLTGDGADLDAGLDQALESGETQTLSLAAPVPVYVLYWTASPDPGGSIEFHRDVYGWDSAILASLKGH